MLREEQTRHDLSWVRDPCQLSPLSDTQHVTSLSVALSCLMKWTHLSLTWKISTAWPQRAPPDSHLGWVKARSSCPAWEEALSHGHPPRNILNSVNCKNMHTSQPDEHPSRTKQSFQSRKHENTAALPLFPEPEALQATERTLQKWESSMAMIWQQKLPNL